MKTEQEIIEEISNYMPYADFVRICRRIAELEKEEDEKLEALSKLQEAYLSASTDAERDYVKQTVGQIRELSKTTRTELRSLRTELSKIIPLATAKDLFLRLQTSQKKP